MTFWRQSRRSQRKRTRPICVFETAATTPTGTRNTVATVSDNTSAQIGVCSGAVKTMRASSQLLPVLYYSPAARKLAPSMTRYHHCGTAR